MKNNEISKTENELSHSQKFTNAVLREYGNNAGEVELTSFQKKLIQNYFIKLDSVLRDAETKRQAKSEQYRDPVPVTWKNINMNKLAFDVVGFSSVGLDPLQSNHINLIPYKNNKNGNYDITGIIGYRGIEIKAKKYGLNPPTNVIVELVYSNDEFQAIKKDHKNEIESYSFDVPNPFDRGQLVGGFYYQQYEDPKNNKLRMMSKKDIEKRKPAYASAEFWGGEKDVYSGGKKTGKETIEGYYDEMCWKTVFRAGYSDVTIDSEKIESYIQSVLSQEAKDYYSLNIQDTTDVDFEIVDEDERIEKVAEKKKAMKAKSLEQGKEGVKTETPNEQPVKQSSTTSVDKTGQATIDMP